MSTLLYAALITKQEEGSSPVDKYLSSMAALVPAEVLTLHGLILSVTTSIDDGKTLITAAKTLSISFYALGILSLLLYVLPRLLKSNSNWKSTWYGWVRALIPPFAFVTWTMLQRSTAFDAVAPHLPSSTRTVIALFVATLLTIAVAYLPDSAANNPQTTHSNGSGI
jgi:hypothetical protein